MGIDCLEICDKFDNKIIVIIYVTCILVLTTSRGLFPNTEQAPAQAPIKPTINLGTCYKNKTHY